MDARRWAPPTEYRADILDAGGRREHVPRGRLWSACAPTQVVVGRSRPSFEASSCESSSMSPDPRTSAAGTGDRSAVPRSSRGRRACGASRRRRHPALYWTAQLRQMNATSTATSRRLSCTSRGGRASSEEKRLPPWSTTRPVATDRPDETPPQPRREPARPPSPHRRHLPFESRNSASPASSPADGAAARPTI